MIRSCLNYLCVIILSISSAFAESAAQLDTNRGAMLYDDHCTQCHTQQVHWQEKKLVNDWKTLVAQVDRWQYICGLEWSKNDTVEVSRYLNNKFYHYP